MLRLATSIAQVLQTNEDLVKAYTTNVQSPTISSSFNSAKNVFASPNASHFIHSP